LARFEKAMIQFGEKVCGDLNAATSREWLETNGLGGFASSTIVGLNTRRYHGLLIAATQPPAGRYALLSKLEETLVIDGRRFELSANRYPGVVHPQGFKCLKDFRLDPFPVFSYEVEGLAIQKAVFMVQGENSTVIQYKLIKDASVQNLQLELRPLIAFRDYHSLTHENGAINRNVNQQSGIASVAPYQGLPSLHLAHNADAVNTFGDWYRNFQYEVERERGLDFSEDLFNPLVLIFNLSTKNEASVIASTEQRDIAKAAELRKAETARRSTTVSMPTEDPFADSLAAAADQCIVGRGDQKTVIAGYHWFGDWGRDTMISLPGLTLVTGRPEVARSILRTFAKYVNQGMLPNRFPDAGETPEYNTVDATLWFLEAARSYWTYSKDLEFIRSELYPVFQEIISWHVGGTRYGIKVDSDGLLSSGVPGVQLTWMDAKVGDWVVTPRRGKPVEIQALWHNALCIMKDWAEMFGDETSQQSYSDIVELAKQSFNRLFWNETERCLYDVVDGGSFDASIRPNQVFAVSLPHGMLSPERAKQVVSAVQKHLLTPYGLRTLAASDPHYRGRYTGGPAERDGAYHQGTVWPWLLGPFISAYMKVNQGTEVSRRQAKDWLIPSKEHLCEAGLGQISEIFDGDPPHRPRGCIAQAWSVAEVLRAYVEDCCALHGVLPMQRAVKS